MFVLFCVEPQAPPYLLSQVPWATSFMAHLQICSLVLVSILWRLFVHGDSANVMYSCTLWRLFLHGDSANIMYNSVLWRLFYMVTALMSCTTLYVGGFYYRVTVLMSCTVLYFGGFFLHGDSATLPFLTQVWDQHCSILFLVHVYQWTLEEGGEKNTFIAFLSMNNNYVTKSCLIYMNFALG